MARILFLTTKQPSTNPRMRKSADAMAKAGHEVHVLYAFNTSGQPSRAIDLSTRRLESRQLEGIRSGQIPMGACVAQILKSPATRNAPCVATYQLHRKGIDWKPDLVIGHPGRLVPVRISKRLNIPALFDAEDYHRGKQPNRQRRQQESATRRSPPPDLAQMTAASPIAQAYRKLYPALRVTTVNNTFPLDCKPNQPRKTRYPLFGSPCDWMTGDLKSS